VALSQITAKYYFCVPAEGTKVHQLVCLLLGKRTTLRPYKVQAQRRTNQS
jgi:hypothetical protein